MMGYVQSLLADDAKKKVQDSGDLRVRRELFGWRACIEARVAIRGRIMISLVKIYDCVFWGVLHLACLPF